MLAYGARSAKESTMLTGTAAIDHAAKHSLPLASYASPVEEAHPVLDVEHARGIAAEDPSLVYLPVIDLYGAHRAGDDSATLQWSRLGVVHTLYAAPVSSYVEGARLAAVLHQEALGILPRALLPLDVYQEAQQVLMWSRLTRADRRTV